MKSPPECEPSTHHHLVAYKNIIPQLKINLKKNPIYKKKRLTCNAQWPAQWHPFLYHVYCWNWNWSPDRRSLAELSIDHGVCDDDDDSETIHPPLLLCCDEEEESFFFFQFCSSYPPIPPVPIITWWRYMFCEQRKGKCFP